MRLIVSDIPEDGQRHEFEVPIALSEDAVPDTARVKITALRLGKKVLIEGSIKMSLSLKCGRCLKDFSYPLETLFRDEFSPAGESSGVGERELTNYELDLSYYSDDEIDLAALVKEQVLLSVPMKPLCAIECRGICSICGQDLNEGTCACKSDKIDPRLAPLEKLKQIFKERKE